MGILRWDKNTDGEFSEEKLADKLESMGYSVNRYIYLPGTYFPMHRHGLDKIDAVVAGRFRMKMNNQEFILEKGDCVEVPKGTDHEAGVVGEEAVVSLDATRE